MMLNETTDNVITLSIIHHHPYPSSFINHQTSVINTKHQHFPFHINPADLNCGMRIAETKRVTEARLDWFFGD